MAIDVSRASKGGPRHGHITPRTRLGAFSVWCIAGCAVLLVITRMLVRTGALGQGGATFFSNVLIAGPMLVSALLAAMALLLGVASFFRGERSLLVGFASLVGFGVTAFAIAEAVGSPA